MNFADKQKKNRWKSMYDPNSESILNKTLPHETSTRPVNRKKVARPKNKHKPKNKSHLKEPKKQPYQKPNHFVKRYKIISDGSYKPDILFAIHNGFYGNNNKTKSVKSNKKKDDPQYEYQKGLEELGQVNDLIKRISKAELSDEEKDCIEKEFMEVQESIKNIEFSDILKRKNNLNDVYDNYLNRFYETKLKEQKNKLNYAYGDISRLTFQQYDKKYCDFFRNLSNENIVNSINTIIKTDSDFSSTLKGVLNYYIKNKSHDLVERYNILIRKIKEPGYKNKKILDFLNEEYDFIIPQLTNLNVLCSYFDFKKIKFKRFNVDVLIEKNNEKVINREYEKNKEFFDNFMGEKLDSDQINIVLSDEDNTKIIAGAGSGKTFTLQAKLKYLLDYKGVNPDKVLCISFSNAAVDDLKRKIDETIGKDNNVSIYTYHALGSKILKDNNDDYIFNEHLLNGIIDYYFEEYVLSDENKMKTIVDFFNLYNYSVNANKRMLKLVKSGDSFKLIDDLTLETLRDKVQSSITYLDILDGEKFSYKRDRVRSYEELMIANFLYIHNIDYIYEYNYFEENDFHDDENFTQYRPDFYLPEHDIYLEHFGVDENLNAYWLKDKSERQLYKKSIKWKRDIHKKHNTKLIETYSHYNKKGILLEKLKDELSDYYEFGKIDYNRIYERLVLNEKLDFLTPVIKTIKKFITLFKDMSLNVDENGDDCSSESFKKIYEEIESSDEVSLKTRNKFLLNIIKDIYDVYNSKDDTDFADMINKPIKLLKDDCKLGDYDYIFVDEYQDTSFNKYRLLKELKKRTKAKLIAIGDDWQSIYGFNGCKIELFTNFEDYFDHTKIFKIQNTYRNSQDLIDLSSEFIKRNTSQISKKLKSNKVLPYNPIKVTKTSQRKKKALILENILDEIIHKYPDGEILILGRYNEDFKQILVPNLIICEDEYRYVDALEKEGYLTIKYLLNENIKIQFRTIHKAKGLQKDNVIIIGLKEGRENGFPSQYGDDSLIKYILKRPEEDISYAEERRLFYVGLTRTKNNVYLIADKENPSSFVEELLYLDEKDSIEFRRYNFGIDDNDRMKNLFRNNQSYSHKSVYSTKLNCKKCGGNIVLHKKKNGRGHFECEDCHFHYGSFNQSPSLLDSLSFCDEEGCNGLNYILKKNKRTFRNCTMFNKTKCNPRF